MVNSVSANPDCDKGSTRNNSGDITHVVFFADNRGNNGPSRHHSVSEYDGNRSGSAAGLQGYYANQRFQPQQQQQQQQQQAQAAAAQAQAQAAAAASAAAQQQSQPPRANEAEQMMQAKRRMAAQRERELRNYHQEQQYNRSKSLAEQQ